MWAFFLRVRFYVFLNHVTVYDDCKNWVCDTKSGRRLLVERMGTNPHRCTQFGNIIRRYSQYHWQAQVRQAARLCTRKSPLNWFIRGTPRS